MGFRHNGVAGKLLTGSAAGDSLLQNAGAGIAVPFPVLVHTSLAAAFYVGWTAATVKAALAK